MARPRLRPLEVAGHIERDDPPRGIGIADRLRQLAISRTRLQLHLAANSQASMPPKETPPRMQGPLSSPNSEATRFATRPLCAVISLRIRSGLDLARVLIS